MYHEVHVVFLSYRHRKWEFLVMVVRTGPVLGQGLLPVEEEIRLTNITTQ